MGTPGRAWTTVLAVIAFLFLLLCTDRLVDDYQAYAQARRLKAERVQELRELELKRDATRSLVEKLRSDPFTQEQLVRRHGYVKPGETIYVLAPAAASSDATPGPTR